jgi:hypothetical protein
MRTRLSRPTSLGGRLFACRGADNKDETPPLAPASSVTPEEVFRSNYYGFRPLHVVVMDPTDHYAERRPRRGLGASGSA